MKYGIQREKGGKFYQVRNDSQGWYIFKRMSSPCYLNEIGYLQYTEYYWKTQKEAEDALKRFVGETMENYIHIDGKDIEISQETVENFRKKFVKEEETFKVGDLVTDGMFNMRIVKKGDYGDGENRIGMLDSTNYILIDNGKFVEVEDTDAIPLSVLEEWFGGVNRVEE